MLTDTAIRALKPGAKEFKKSDTGGLHLLIKLSGAKLWRLPTDSGKSRRCSSAGNIRRAARRRPRFARSGSRATSCPDRSAPSPVGCVGSRARRGWEYLQDYSTSVDRQHSPTMVCEIYRAGYSPLRNDLFPAIDHNPSEIDGRCCVRP